MFAKGNGKGVGSQMAHLPYGELVDAVVNLRDQSNAIRDDIAQILLQMQLSSRVKDDILTFPYEDREFHFYLPYAGNDIVQSNMVAKYTFWELSNLEKVRKYIPLGGVVVDAGANIGNHSVYFAAVCKAGKVFAFEPQVQVGRILKRNLELNGVLGQVEVVPVALSSQNGRMTIGFNDVGNVAGMSFRSEDGGCYEARTLDAMAYGRLDFLKIDVEGAQLKLLQGAEKTLTKLSPVIWIEMLNEQYARGGLDRKMEVEEPVKL